MELSSIFNAVLLSSAMGTVVALLILTVKMLFKNVFDARWHYYIWFVLLLRLFIPYGPESTLSIFNLFEPSYQSAETGQHTKPIISPNLQHTVGSVSYPGQVTFPEPAKKAAPAQNKKFGFGYRELALLWFFGAIFSGIYLLALNIRLYLRVNSLETSADTETVKILENCKTELKVRTPIPIIDDTNVKSPFLFGLFKPKLVLALNILKRLSPEEKRYIFLHELTHLKRKDILIAWVLAILQVLHWFNPVIWYAFYRLRQDCEMACDASVLSRLHPTEYRSYGETIISFLNILSGFRWVPGTTGIANNKSNLKARIKMISMFKKSSYKWSVIAACLVLLTGCVSLTNSRGGTKDHDNVSLLSLNDVIEAFAEEGLKLSSSSEAPPVEVKTDTEAHAFTINDNEGTLFIYVFNSMEKGKKFPKYEFANAYRAKNVGVVYLPEEYHIHNVGTVVFEKLNDLETLVFEGTGAYWKARIVTRQYEYWWIDGKGLRRYESFCINMPAICYRDDISAINSIEYEFKHPGGASSGTTPPRTKEDGYIHLGSTGGTGVMQAGDVVTFTIKWNGKEETLELSIKPEGQQVKDEIEEKKPEYAADRAWVTLGEWLGEGRKTTETFVTETDRWEMDWKVLCEDKNVDTFLEVNVTKPGENTPAWTLSYFGGYNGGKWHGQNIQVRIPPGEYYLEITAENIRWEIVAKKPGGSR